MLEVIQGLPPGIDGLKAVGTVSKEDYDRVIEPMVDRARAEGRLLRLLYAFGPEFQGFSAGGTWADLRIGLGAMRRFAGCAIVSELPAVRGATTFASVFMPFPVRVFRGSEMEAAVAWLKSLGSPGIAHRLVPEQGVMVIEVNGPLRAEDFDALSAAADAWIEAHARLNGLVVHASSFPGWDSFDAFLHHIRFVRDHHRKIRRIAVAADGAIAKIGPAIAKHFVQAEVKRFDHAALDQAIAWAGAAG
jgi:hypothetical protein